MSSGSCVCVRACVCVGGEAVIGMVAKGCSARPADLERQVVGHATVARIPHGHSPVTSHLIQGFARWRGRGGRGYQQCGEGGKGWLLFKFPTNIMSENVL